MLDFAGENLLRLHQHRGLACRQRQALLCQLDAADNVRSVEADATPVWGCAIEHKSHAQRHGGVDPAGQCARLSARSGTSSPAR